MGQTHTKWILLLYTLYTVHSVYKELSENDDGSKRINEEL